MYLLASSKDKLFCRTSRFDGSFNDSLLCKGLDTLFTSTIAGFFGSGNLTGSSLG